MDIPFAQTAASIAICLAMITTALILAQALAPAPAPQPLLHLHPHPPPPAELMIFATRPVLLAHHASDQPTLIAPTGITATTLTTRCMIPARMTILHLAAVAAAAAATLPTLPVKMFMAPGVCLAATIPVTTLMMAMFAVPMDITVKVDTLAQLL